MSAQNTLVHHLFSLHKMNFTLNCVTPRPHICVSGLIAMECVTRGLENDEMVHNGSSEGSGIMMDRVTWPHATCVIVSLFLSANMVPHAVISPYKYLSNISIAILSLIIQVPYQNKNVILQWQWASSWATYRTCSLCFTQLDCLHLSRVAAIRVVDLYCRVEDVFASISSTFASCRRLFAMVRPSAAERRPDL